MVLRTFSEKINTFLLKKWQNNRCSREDLMKRHCVKHKLQYSPFINSWKISRELIFVNHQFWKISRELFFANQHFRGSKKGIYFRIFGQNSRNSQNFLPAKISSLKVVLSFVFFQIGRVSLGLFAWSSKYQKYNDLNFVVQEIVCPKITGARRGL